LKKMIAELYGKETGCTGGRGGSMHLCDLDAGFMASTAIVANSIPLAVGHALHMKTQKMHSVAVTYFGEGATEEGAFYESLNFAVLKSLPVVFACENNRYSVYSPLSVRQPKGRSIKTLAESIGARAQEVDGNNAVDVVNAMIDAKQCALKGDGPVLLECHTYRHREHCGPNWDDDLGYRPIEEVEAWLDKDPLKVFEQAFEGELNKPSLVDGIRKEIDNAFSLAEQANFPPLTSREDHLYA